MLSMSAALLSPRPIRDGIRLRNVRPSSGLGVSQKTAARLSDTSEEKNTIIRSEFLHGNPREETSEVFAASWFHARYGALCVSCGGAPVFLGQEWISVLSNEKRSGAQVSSSTRWLLTRVTNRSFICNISAVVRVDVEIKSCHELARVGSMMRSYIFQISQLKTSIIT